MSDRDKRQERAQFAPSVILCNSCDGLGTQLVQKDRRVWVFRSTKGCSTCQETGLKGIPESEVNSMRIK